MNRRLLSHSWHATPGMRVLGRGPSWTDLSALDAQAKRLTARALPVKAMAGVEPGFVELAEPEVHTCTLSDQSDPANDWLCAWCLNRVASEKDRARPGGQSEFSFVNPQGVRFHILTFSSTFGCRQAGVPTLEHTWFPGHAWSYCACDSCGVHLGWFYSGPAEFVGLIRDRIVRALLIRN